MCIYLHTHHKGVYVRIHIGVGFALLFYMVGQCEGLKKRNSNSAVPLFLCTFCYLLSMNNFSFRGQGVLRTSRYGEKLFVDLVADSKRTNKNQCIICLPYRKEVLCKKSHNINTHKNKFNL